MTALQQILWSEGVYRLGWALLHSLWRMALVGALAAVFPLTFAESQTKMPGPGARMAAETAVAAMTPPDTRPSFRTQPPFPAISRGLRPYLKDYAAPATTLRAGFVPYKAQLVRGEPLEVTFTVENLGPEEFQFLFGCDSRGKGRHDRFKIAVTDAAGKLLPDPREHFGKFGGLGSVQTLKPGQTFTDTIDLTHFRAIDGAGVYTISCSFAFDEPDVVKTGPAKPVVEAGWPRAVTHPGLPQTRTCAH